MPLPAFSDDDFVNFCVAEALMVRARMEDIEAEKRREMEEWKRRPLGSE
jgi:hypothetical protein